VVAFDCREIEPLVRGDEIDGHIAPDRIHDAKFKEHVASGRPLAERRHICIQHFQASHRSPLLSPHYARICEAAASCPGSQADHDWKF
jgi:hypothetical protein